MPPKGRAVAAGPGTALPTKERALFTRLIQEYETKKFKLGLKTADTILKKHPEHGETLCMKGLLLASTGDRQQGLELAKQGVRKDLMSFICWHALGILNRMDKNYEEAIKCYGQALRIEGGTNLNLIRESSYMYMQSRNYPALIDNRVNLLRMQPHLRNNWAALATAYHLAGRLDEAEKVLAQWQSTCRDVPKRSYEHSEMLLYRASILLEAGRHQDLLNHLAESSSRIVDRRTAQVMEGKALLALNQLDKAQALWRKLIDANPEDQQYVSGWVQSKAAAGNDQEAVAALRELQTLFPRSQCAKRMELTHLAGSNEAFSSAFEAYLSRALTKGVPSIFADIKSLLSDSDKCSAAERVALALLQKYSPSTSSDEPPSSYLWTLYFLAQFYSYRQQPEQALSYIESAIAHTPTLPELHMTKARILKRAGAVQAASHAMEDARLLDGQDRFLNSKDAKYKLRIGQAAAAEKVMGLFTKPDAPSPLSDLLEMQAIWFILEAGLSHEAAGQNHLALKRYAQTEKIFEDHWDDQLDFHSYCVRKFTLRDYVDMCRWEDGVRGHAGYREAAIRAVGVYLRIYDDAQANKGSGSSPAAGEVNGNGSVAASSQSDDAKKEAKRLKKAEAKRKAEEEAKKQAAAAAAAKQKANGKGAAQTDDEEVNAPPPDPDPEGWTLLQREEPLEEVERLLKSLQTHAARDPRVWVATFELGLRRGNWLLCASALRRGTDACATASSPAIAAEAQGRLHVQRLQLLSSLPTDLSTLDEPTRAGITAALGDDLSAPSGVSLQRINDDHLQRTGDVLSHSRGALVLGGKQAEQEVKAALLHLASQPGTKLPTLLSAWTFLQGSTRTPAGSVAPLLPGPHLSAAASPEELEQFRSKAHGLQPLAEEFLTGEESEKRRERREKQRKDWEACRDGEEGVPAEKLD
ncbi:N-terminal acetyltransferase A, auxiliary subunit [Jaminaea rosea]|uniref:N-terminal acetyltransferase A, auxiliary subunit n=1 Tax=Jaminaea rosea TaxID=1569628 RepID=A0A316UPI7_9BASI|nr:N-terminal acetyltransferase A, auxiliary subunit [Jaminaea rosea]PWN27190.1 N-terminal acetyltransferase A, auxiliary subunit [Jaminaea rosea]